jgi:flagellar basal body rod protein FlgG
MNYGLQISASGALTSMYRQDVLANNLANMNTVGYKPDIPATIQRDPARIEDGLGRMASNRLIERLGAGVLSAPNRVSFAQGTLEVTNRSLDLALEGDGFFVVQGEAQGGAGTQIRLTRDGRLSLNADGQLVMATTGLPVLDIRNQPIVPPGEGEIGVAVDGTLTQNGEIFGRLQIADVPDRSVLSKEGSGLFTPSAAGVASVTPIEGRVRQGAVEGAAVNEIAAMMQVTSASRSVQTNIGMITYHDRLMEQAINTFGRTA